MTKEQATLRTILIVDDNLQNITLLEAVLSAEYRIRTATKGSEALKIARKTPPDLILLDIMMPEMNGYDICRALKADATTKSIPVIFVTSLLNSGDEALGFEAGGVDYITKPVIGAVVRTRVKAHLALKIAQDDLEKWNRELELQKLKLEAQNVELRRVRETLELSRDKYAGLYDFAPVGYFTFDVCGHIREANLTGAILLGIERRLLDDIPFNIFIADADGRDAFANHLKTVLHIPGVQKCEIRLTRKDATVMYGEFQSVVVETGIIDTDGYILTSITDGTLAKQLETEIKDAREYAENIVETVRKPLVVLNSDLKILTANLSFYETFQVTSGETIGNSIYDLGNRQWDIPKLRALFENILPNDTVFNNYEVEHNFQTIGMKVILLNGRQIFRENIGSHIILLAMEDITERKRLEEERSRLAMIVESSNDAIFSVSPDDVITSWNGGAENIFGYTAGNIIGSHIFTLLPAECNQQSPHIWQTILSGEQLQYFETNRVGKNEGLIYVSFTASPLLNADGKIIGNSVIARDVTERREMEETIKHQAHYDALTNLPNRQFFMDILSLELAKARRNGKKLALLFLDLNGFKQVNDTFGHSCGDHLLQEVARRLRAGIRESDIVARLGGDEFTVLLPDLTHADDVGFVLKKILGVFETPFMLDEVAVDSATSIGICMFPDDGTSSDVLMKKADSAMYEAKSSGRNSHKFYCDQK
ncbi:MAG: diguanylate cyclase [Desulfuromonadales bacterium]